MEFKEYPIKLSYEDLETYTGNFSEQNYIGDFQFGKVYHGKITLPDSAKPKLVTVKVWRIPDLELYLYFQNENAHRLMDELIFLQRVLPCPGLMKPYGYCIKPEQCGIVYDFKAYNTLFNLATTDEFKWSQRIKVALRFAQLLRHLHVNCNAETPLLIRNIHPAHVMVDEDWNPILYDFGMISGGMFPDKLRFPLQHIRHCYGCYDPFADTQKDDVYAFGIILLSLIMKEVYTEEDRKNNELDMPERAFIRQGKEEILAKIKDEDFHFSLVHKSLEADESFCCRDGPTITRLSIACVEDHPKERPTMNQVVKRLQKLQVVRRQPQLNVYIERKEKMKNEAKRKGIAFGEVKLKTENIPSRKMEVKREDIASGEVEVKKENIPSRKMEVKREDIASGKVKVKRENIPSRKVEVKREDIASGKVKVKKGNIPSRKMEVKREDFASGKVKVKKENTPFGQQKVNQGFLGPQKTLRF